MAVLKANRNVGELEVLLKAEGLVSHTLSLLSNEKYFPKRHRWFLSANIAEIACSICENISTANGIRVSNQKTFNERRLRQELAHAKCDSMICFVKIAKELFHLPSAKVQYWTSLIVEVQRLIGAWQKSDEKRYENKVGN